MLWLTPKVNVVLDDDWASCSGMGCIDGWSNYGSGSSDLGKFCFEGLGMPSDSVSYLFYMFCFKLSTLIWLATVDTQNRFTFII